MRAVDSLFCRFAVEMFVVRLRVGAGSSSMLPLGEKLLPQKIQNLFDVRQFLDRIDFNENSFSLLIKDDIGPFRETELIEMCLRL